MSAVEVIYTDEFGTWFDSLTEREQDEVGIVIGLLENLGVALGTPASSALRGSRFAFRELRPKRGKSPLRFIYVFDPRRAAVLLIGGDKGGDSKFYDRFIRKAERIWQAYLADLMAGKHEKGGGS